ncbi:MAG: glycogen synthase GlgA [Candidatus Omnitrophica bacterium]|nr:glycogen synthase GlgA [Candidatus Omnitrophota bacterium]MBL7210402.1 glycogen synthase GlgA [Candidatus Omnitrophota bacterium]
MKIAIAASEVVPFAKTGGLADVAGALPLALEELGAEVIVIMPRYKCVDSAGYKIERLNKETSFSLIGKNIRIYFIENSEYFNRDGLYGDKKGDYKDNLDRFSFYCRRVLELLKEINFKAEVIHLHDWQAALIPLYLKAEYNNDPFYKDTKTLLTVHNIGYQGIFPKEEFAKLRLEESFFSIEGLEFYGKINILKGGLEASDIINTVSPTYSKEIQGRELGFGLEGVLKKRADRLFGILNGLDYSVWDPQTDNLIAQRYSLRDPQGKSKDKKELQLFCGLADNPAVPLAGIVSRLAQQKGFDILSTSLAALCKMGLQLVILGSGDLKYQRILQKAAEKYKGIISLHLKFDDALAHKIYAGSDMFLMPSRYEPCGLGQMISLRYGTVPVVFKTGGLADTVNVDNGFVFEEYNKKALLAALAKAIEAFKDKEGWPALIRRAMQACFSWEESAKKYLELYAKAAD